MLEVDPDQTLADIRDAVRKYRDEIPEIGEVKISANKDELIEQVNEALDAYVRRITSLEDQPELHMDVKAEEVFESTGTDGGAPQDETAEDATQEDDEDESENLRADIDLPDPTGDAADGVSEENASSDPASPRPGNPLRRNVP